MIYQASPQFSVAATGSSWRWRRALLVFWSIRQWHLVRNRHCGIFWALTLNRQLSSKCKNFEELPNPHFPIPKNMISRSSKKTMSV